jgi:4-aminobutyrate aminotransferase-like enzyme
MRGSRAQLDEGVILSLPHPIETEVAELICDFVPCAEMVRFGKNGSDATAGAIRVARAYTGAIMSRCAAITAGRTGTSGRPRATAACPRRHAI